MRRHISLPTGPASGRFRTAELFSDLETGVPGIMARFIEMNEDRLR